MKLLLDTSIIIDFLRSKNKEETVLARLARANEDLYISIITHTELYAGKSVWASREAREELEAIFWGLTIISEDIQISQKAGEIRAECGIDLLDAIIAATALVRKLEVVTFNTRDFRKVKNLKIYKI